MEESDQVPKHSTKIITIRSVSDYLEKIFLNKQDNFYHQIADMQTMYRGQLNSSWEPLPSVFRSKEDFLNEHVYIREYERIMPERCEDKSSIEILIDAQHYGIPTRLLDVTSNPLVALYFACSGPSDRRSSSDGVVIQFAPAGVFMQDDLSCNLQAEYVRHYKNGVHFPVTWKNNLIDSVRRSNNRFSSDVYRTATILFSEHLMQFFFLPKYVNQRIAAQEGAFLLCSTPLVKRPDLGYGEEIFLLPDEIKQDYENKISFRYIIPYDLKEDILYQLDYLGINEAKLFPDIEHRVKSIVSKIRHATNPN